MSSRGRRRIIKNSRNDSTTAALQTPRARPVNKKLAELRCSHTSSGEIFLLAALQTVKSLRSPPFFSCLGAATFHNSMIDLWRVRHSRYSPARAATRSPLLIDGHSIRSRPIAYPSRALINVKSDFSVLSPPETPHPSLLCSASLLCGKKLFSLRLLMHRQRRARKQSEAETKASRNCLDIHLSVKSDCTPEMAPERSEFPIRERN
jgi:hypothetical protein